MMVVTVVMVTGIGEGRTGNNDEQKNSSEKPFHAPNVARRTLRKPLDQDFPHQNRNGIHALLRPGPRRA
jgi:hypothetical protein